MALDDERLKTLATVPTEYEASAIISALEAEGIRATAVGGYIAGFKAEAPGGVAVIVAESDIERGREILNQVRVSGPDIDWSQVDVGDSDENPDADADAATDGTGGV